MKIIFSYFKPHHQHLQIYYLTNRLLLGIYNLMATVFNHILLFFVMSPFNHEPSNSSNCDCLERHCYCCCYRCKKYGIRKPPQTFYYDATNRMHHTTVNHGTIFSKHSQATSIKLSTFTWKSALNITNQGQHSIDFCYITRQINIWTTVN